MGFGKKEVEVNYTSPQVLSIEQNTLTTLT